MSKEKQIEEMWNIIVTDCDGECVGCEYENDDWCFTHRVINNLYNAGYRKQEWISVEERLPNKELETFRNGNKNVLYPCLVYVKYDWMSNGYVTKAWYTGDMFVDVDTSNLTEDVTHWMPLPEAPKKGGA